MSLRTLTRIAAITLTALSAVGAQASDGATLTTQKSDAAHAAVQAAQLDLHPAVINAAADRARALRAVHVDSANEQPTVSFVLTHAVPVRTGANPDRTQITIDFYDTLLLPDLQTMIIDGGNLIQDVDTELLAVHPQFITRTRITLVAAAAHTVTTDGKDVVLTLSAAPGAQGAVNNFVSIANSTLDEIAARAESNLEDAKHQIHESLALAERQIETARVALIKAQFADVAPATTNTQTDTDALNTELEGRITETNYLSNLYAAELQTLAGRYQRARATITTAANETDAYDIVAEYKIIQNAALRALDTLAVRGQRQAQANQLLTFRIQQSGMTELAAQANQSQDNSLQQLDRAFAGLRQNTGAETEIAESISALDQAIETVNTPNVKVDVRPTTQHAALTDKQQLSVPPAPRTKPARHHFGLDVVENPVQMAFLRSDANDVADAEDRGIIVLAQQQADEGVTDSQGTPATQIEEHDTNGGPRKFSVPKASGAKPQFSLYNPDVPASEDPLRQLIDIDFRDMDLTNIVSLLARKGEINVIGSTEIEGTVTADLKNIPLGRAIEIVLRMNGLGIVEEAGVYRITSYEESIALQRETRMIFLKNTQADEIKTTLDDVLSSSINGELVSVSANPATNVVIIAGPREAVDELEGVVSQLDISEPVVPTITVPIKLNYSDPAEMLAVTQGLISEVGSIAADVRSRHLVVTDVPVNVQEIQALIQSIDTPVKQVAIDAMVVDAQLDDNAQMGIDWLAQSTEGVLQTTESTFESDATGTTLESSGNVISEIGGLASFLPVTQGAQVFFNVLSGGLDLSAIIAAEVRSNNAELLANPSVVTVENKSAIINITQEFPYQELTSTSGGGNLATTAFKEVGTILEVLPRVTHDSHVIAAIDAKQSIIVGTSATGVPIEAKRLAQTTLRVADGQTIFIGGLRSFDERFNVRKTPILGDIPILNFLFTTKTSEQTNKELLIFLTCNVLPDAIPDLTPYEKERFDKLGGTPWKVDGTRALVRSYIHPEEMRDPIYKWRRSK